MVLGEVQHTAQTLGLIPCRGVGVGRSILGLSHTLLHRLVTSGCELVEPEGTSAAGQSRVALCAHRGDRAAQACVELAVVRFRLCFLGAQRFGFADDLGEVSGHYLAPLRLASAFCASAMSWSKSEVPPVWL